MISARNISKTFGERSVVNNLSFEVAAGETFILLGTSGCGKTTTLKMINRLIEPNSGEIFVNGSNTRKLKAEKLRKSMGYVLQRNSLFPHYTVFENIALVPRLLKWDQKKISDRIHELIIKLHLSPSYLSLYPNRLSGGEVQRVNLARALAADPPILLMDEPFSALDTITRSAIRKEFNELDELKKKTIVMVTHDVQEAFEMGNRICLMDKGNVMQIGTASELLFHPANDFVRSFLSDAFMQLALLVTPIKNIWHYLSEETPVNNLNSININSQSTVLKAIEQVKDKNDKETLLVITHEEENKQKVVSWQNLLTAFSEYQLKK